MRLSESLLESKGHYVTDAETGERIGPMSKADMERTSKLQAMAAKAKARAASNPTDANKAHYEKMRDSVRNVASLRTNTASKKAAGAGLRKARKKMESLSDRLSEAADFVDAGKAERTSLAQRVAWKFAHSQIVWIRDAKGAVEQGRYASGNGAEGLRKTVELLLRDHDSPFQMDTNDDEIFADGPDTFADGEWGYRSVSAYVRGIAKALEHRPPVVKIEKVQGRTGAGWKLTSSTGSDYYHKQGLAAMKADQSTWDIAKPAKSGYGTSTPS